MKLAPSTNIRLTRYTIPHDPLSDNPMTTVYYVDKGKLDIVGGGGPLPPKAGHTAGPVESQPVATPRSGAQDVGMPLAHKKKRPSLFPSRKGRNSVKPSARQSQDSKSVDKRSMIAKMGLRKKSSLSGGNDGAEKALTTGAPVEQQSKRSTSRKPPRFPRKFFEGKKIEDKGLTIIEPERKRVGPVTGRPVKLREQRNVRGASSPKGSEKKTRIKQVPQPKDQGMGGRKGDSSISMESGLRIQVFDSPVTAQRKVSVTLIDTDKTVQVQGDSIEPFLAIILREAIRNNQDVHIENGVVGELGPNTHSFSSPAAMKKSVSFVGRRSFTTQGDPEPSLSQGDNKDQRLIQGEMYMKKVSSFGSNPVDSKNPTSSTSLESSSKKENLLNEVSTIVSKMKAKEGLFHLKTDNGNVNTGVPKSSFYALPAIFSNVNSRNSNDWRKQKMSIGQILSSNLRNSFSTDAQDNSIGPRASFSGYHESCHWLRFEFPSGVTIINPFQACSGRCSSTTPSTVGDVMHLVPCTRVDAVVDDHLGISEDDDEHEQVPVNRSAVHFSRNSASSFEANIPSNDYLLDQVLSRQSFVEHDGKIMRSSPSEKDNDRKISQAPEPCSDSIEASSPNPPKSGSIDIIDMHRQTVNTRERGQTNSGGISVSCMSLVPEQLAAFQTPPAFDVQYIFSLFGFESKRNRDDLDAFYQDDAMFTQSKPMKEITKGPIAKKQSVSKYPEGEEGRKDRINGPQSWNLHSRVKDAPGIKSTQSVIERIRANSEESRGEFRHHLNNATGNGSTKSVIERIRANTEDSSLAASSVGEVHKYVTSGEDRTSGTETETDKPPSGMVSILLNVEKEETGAQPSAWGGNSESEVDAVHTVSSTTGETANGASEVVESPTTDKRTNTAVVERTCTENKRDISVTETISSEDFQKQKDETGSRSTPDNDSPRKEERCCTTEATVDKEYKEEFNESIPARLSVSFAESESCESIECPSDYTYTEEDTEESIAVNVSFAPNIELLRLDKIMSWAQETFSWEVPESENLKFLAGEAQNSLASFSQRSLLSSQIGTVKSDLDSMGTEETGFLQFEGAGSPLMEAFVFYVEDTIDSLHDASLDVKSHGKSPLNKAASFS